MTPVCIPGLLGALHKRVSTGPFSAGMCRIPENVRNLVHNREGYPTTCHIAGSETSPVTQACLRFRGDFGPGEPFRSPVLRGYVSDSRKRTESGAQSCGLSDDMSHSRYRLIARYTGLFTC